MSSLGAFFAAEENRKRRDRICRGKAEAIRKGRKPAGPTPFGYLYDRKTGAWSIDPELGPIVVEVFGRVSHGETCESVARDLQARGVPCTHPSKTGRRTPGVWSRERVHKIVRARTYLGTWVANRAQALTVPVPRIVEDQLYARADTALRRNGHRGQLRNSHRYLLQGISTCGVCGSRIGCASTGSWRTGKGARRTFYYVCSRRRRPKPEQRACTLPMFRSDIIDARLWETIVDRVIREDLLKKAVTEVSEGADPNLNRKALPRLEARLEHLIRAEEVLLERFRRDLITDSVLDKELGQLSKDRAAVKNSIEAAKAAGTTRPTPIEAAMALKVAVDGLREKVRIATLEDRRDIVRAIVARDENAVKLGPQRIEAQISLAPQADSSVAQLYAAG